jgi:hypothetical protein
LEREIVGMPVNSAITRQGSRMTGCSRYVSRLSSGLPGSEWVTLLTDGGTSQRTIRDVVDQRVEGSAIAFHPITLKVGFHSIAEWRKEAPDRILEVRLSSGRSIRGSARRSFFTLDLNGDVRPVPARELKPGSRLAIPRRIPDPSSGGAVLNLPDLAPPHAWESLVLEGPSIAAAFRERGWEMDAILKQIGIGHVSFYRQRRRMPYWGAVLSGISNSLTAMDRLGFRGSRHTLPIAIEIDEDLAWLIGLYVAEGYRRRGQVVLANTDRRILARVERVGRRLGVGAYRGPHSVTLSSSLLSEALSWIGVGGKAHSKRVPFAVCGWPQPLVQSFFDGLVDGDGSREKTRISVWTVSDDLASDLLWLAPRLGMRAAAWHRNRGENGLYQIGFPYREHKLQTAIPNPRALLLRIRREAGLRQNEASMSMGYRSETGLNNLEKRYENVRRATLLRIRDFYAGRKPPPNSVQSLNHIVEGDLAWDSVAYVKDTKQVEAVYDLRLNLAGSHTPNILAGRGGIFQGPRTTV